MINVKYWLCKPIVLCYIINYVFCFYDGWIIWPVYPLLGNESVNTFMLEPTRNIRTFIAMQRISKRASLK
jgi:hypothetical protein